jgi:hypothetical protein
LILGTNAVSALLSGDQTIAERLTRSNRRERLGTMLALLIARSSVLAIGLDTTLH